MQQNVVVDMKHFFNDGGCLVIFLLVVIAVALTIYNVRAQKEHIKAPSTMTIEGHDYFVTQGYYGYMSLCHKGNCKECERRNRE